MAESSGSPHGNFSFLADDYPDWYRILVDAEVAALSNASDALVHVRGFAELFCRAQLGPSARSITLHASIKQLRASMPRDEYKSLERIRKLGNRGAHVGSVCTYKDAEQVLRDAHRVCIWLVREGGEAGFRVAPYEPPRSALHELCRNAAKLDGRIRHVGFHARVAGLHIPADDLFVASVLRDATDEFTTDELLGRVLDDPNYKLVILGDAGLGKSTICRWLLCRLVASKRVCLMISAPVLRAGILRGIDSLLGVVYQELAQRHGVALSREAFEHLWRDGESVLIVDGLDECGEAHEREKLRDWLDAFAQRRSGLIITSRVHGYDHLPLVEVPVADLLPWDAGGVETFFSRWLQHRTNDDDQARRQATVLAETIAGNSGSAELAQVPMFATLIALLHDQQQTIPGDRGRLYRHAVLTLLRDWPRARGVHRTLEVEDQLCWLEHLASALLDEPRPPNMDRVIDLVQEAGGGRPVPNRAVTEGWIEFLVRDAGLLREYESDRFDFAHLTLHEYLCASDLLRRPSDPAAAIVERRAQWRWVGSCALAITLAPSQQGLIDRVLDGLLGRPDAVETEPLEDALWWVFVVGWARDVVLSPRALERVLRRKSQEILRDARAFDVPSGAFTVVRWSPASYRCPASALGQEQAVIDGWIDEKLTSDVGESLREAFALAACHWNRSRIVTLFQSRSDLGRACASLLEFWPTNHLLKLTAGDQASLDSALAEGGVLSRFIVGHVDLSGALAWARGVADAALLEVALTVLALPDTDALAQALLPRLLAFEPVAERGWLQIKDGPAVLVPAEVALASKTIVGEAHTSGWCRSRAAAAMSFYHEHLAHVLHVTPRQCIDRAMVVELREGLVQISGSSLPTGKLDDWLKLILDRSPLPRDIGMLSICSMGSFTLEQVHARTLTLELHEQRPRPAPRPSKIIEGHVCFFEHLNSTTNIPLHQHLGRAQATEMTVALYATQKASIDVVQRYLHWRLLGRWLTELWPAVEGCVGAPPIRPAQASLLLALGWIVRQVTGDWPAAPYWPELLRVEGPGDDLLAAMQGLCRAADRGDLPAQRRVMSTVLDGFDAVE